MSFGLESISFGLIIDSLP